MKPGVLRKVRAPEIKQCFHKYNHVCHSSKIQALILEALTTKDIIVGHLAQNVIC